jgi:hypothetical protein
MGDYKTCIDLSNDLVESLYKSEYSKVDSKMPKGGPDFKKETEQI